MDRRKIIRDIIPTRFLENEQLRRVYLEPIIEEFGLVSDYVELMQNFGSIEGIPEEYLDDLGDKLGYTVMPSENLDIQREIIKRVIQLYKDRSKVAEIERVLESATDRNWIGGDLTLYKGEVRKGYQSISYPRDSIFFHDKSMHDRGCHYADKMNYNYGIINLEAQFIDERTIEMLEKQIPGGVRWNLNQALWIGGDSEQGIPRYPYIAMELEKLEDLTIATDRVFIKGRLSYFDSIIEGVTVRSGREYAKDYVEEDIVLRSEKEEYRAYVVDETNIKGIRYRDVNYHDDGKSVDGLDERSVVVFARYRELLPYDMMYSVESVIDKVITDNSDSLQYGFEVEVS